MEFSKPFAKIYFLLFASIEIIATFVEKRKSINMDLRFDTSLIIGYKSAAQIARILTEDWLAKICIVLYVEKSPSEKQNLMLP